MKQGGVWIFQKVNRYVQIMIKTVISQPMLNGQHIEMRVNGASTICGLVSTVIEEGFGRCYAYPTYWLLL